MIEYTSKLANFAAGVSLEKVPPEIVGFVKQLLLDQVGCQVACATLPWSTSFYQSIKSLGTSAGATVVYYGDSLSVDNAAFLNSVFGHGNEIDDTHIKSPTHPGAVIIPAVLALAEREHLSGKSALEAIIAGYEVMLRISCAVSPHLHERGHHSPPAVGSFGAAAATSRLLGLDGETCLNAMAIAGSHSAGLLEYTQVGGSVKRIHCAIPAMSGLRSTLMATHGITGPRTVLEGNRGFCKTFAGNYNLELLIDSLGERYRMMEVGFKPYNCCYYIHAPLEALDALQEEHSLGVDDIASITVGVSEQGRKHVGIITEPVDILGAQFSMAFSLAVRLLKGSNGFWDYTEEDLKDPRFLDIARRIGTVMDPVAEKEHPGNFGALVTVTTRDGRELKKRVRFSKGLPENPMSENELRDKFCNLVNPQLGSKAADRLTEMILALDQVGDVSELLPLSVRENSQK